MPRQMKALTISCPAPFLCPISRRATVCQSEDSSSALLGGKAMREEKSHMAYLGHTHSSSIHSLNSQHMSLSLSQTLRLN